MVLSEPVQCNVIKAEVQIVAIAWLFQAAVVADVNNNKLLIVFEATKEKDSRNGPIKNIVVRQSF